MHVPTAVAMPPTNNVEHVRVASVERRAVRTPAAEDAALAALPRVVVEERTLDPGVVLVFRDDPARRRFRVAWDPAQISRAELLMFTSIFIASPGEYAEVSPETDRALRHIDALREHHTDTPAWTRLLDLMSAAIIRTGDPDGVTRQVLDLIGQVQQENVDRGVVR